MLAELYFTIHFVFTSLQPCVGWLFCPTSYSSNNHTETWYCYKCSAGSLGMSYPRRFSSPPRYASGSHRVEVWTQFICIQFFTLSPAYVRPTKYIIIMSSLRAEICLNWTLIQNCLTGKMKYWDVWLHQIWLFRGKIHMIVVFPMYQECFQEPHLH